MTGPPPRDLGPAQEQPLRRSIRRLRWFKSSFRTHVEEVGSKTGITFDIDDQRLAASFLGWLKAFDAQRPEAEAERLPFVGFAAGLMLCELVGHRPLRATSVPAGAEASDPTFFWPEGHAYVSYCLSMRAAVLEQDFGTIEPATPQNSDIRTWWSFRENVTADPTLSTAFLDLFAGQHPKWHMPQLFQADGEEGAVIRLDQNARLSSDL